MSRSYANTILFYIKDFDHAQILVKGERPRANPNRENRTTALHFENSKESRLHVFPSHTHTQN